MNIQWHSQFVRIISNDIIMLIGESASYKLAGETYLDIDKIVASKQSVYQWPSYGIYEHAALVDIIHRLIDQNLLEIPEEGPGQKTRYFTPSFDNKLEHDRITNSLVFTEHGHLIRDLHTKAPLLHDTTSVFVDDYFDPRLNEFSKESCSNTRAWIPIKLFGRHILAGPLIHGSHDNNDAPCWRCVTDTLGHNQPARTWATRSTQGKVVALPLELNSEHVIDAFNTLHLPLCDLAKKHMSHQMLSYEPHTQTLLTHTVRRRPQCPTCGNPQLMSQQAHRKVILNEHRQVNSKHNGSRTKSASDTLKRLSSFISPLTGIVSMLEPFTPSPIEGSDLHPNENALKKESLTIYKSAFFKTPYFLDNDKHDPFSQMCLGKGMDSEQCKVSALGEAIERCAAHYQGDEDTQLTRPSELPHRAIPPSQLAGFSDEQYKYFSQNTSCERTRRHGVAPYPSDEAIQWTKAWSLSSEEYVFLPTSYCFGSSPFKDLKYCRWGSNGCAAGNTIEEAILQGLLEVIERDATAIWWYNKLTRPEIDLSILPTHKRTRIDNTISEHWHYWVLDISHDMRVPVTVAIAQHKTTQQFIFGFGCHPILTVAVERALTEMCQLLPIRDQAHKPFNFDDVVAEPYLFPCRQAEPQNHALKVGLTLQAHIEAIIQQLASLNLEVITLNYSRPDFPLYTLNTCVPNAAHIWPQLACRRLYEVPVHMGWRAQALDERQLNPLALYI